MSVVHQLIRQRARSTRGSDINDGPLDGSTWDGTVFNVISRRLTAIVDQFGGPVPCGGDASRVERGARDLKMIAAGSPANVAGLLAQLGHNAMWASVVPQGYLGDHILTEYRSVGVDLGQVLRTEEGRVALYFLEPADDPMAATVTYA